MAARRCPVQAVPPAGVLEVPGSSGVHKDHHDLRVTSLTCSKQGSVAVTVHHIGIGSMLQREHRLGWMTCIMVVS